MTKKRIDLLLVEQGLAPSRERAQAFVMAGQVIVNEHKVVKSSEQFPEDAVIRLKGKDHPYVSRGGVKCAAALDTFSIDVKGQVALDVGASTGGFTDCLLQRGTKRIYTVDVGSNQLAWSLRQDERVVVREQCHAKEIKADFFLENIDLIVMDVSFISVKKIIPHLLQNVPGLWSMVLLIKPQFELSPKDIAKGGIVKDPRLHEKVCEEIQAFVTEQGMFVQGLIPSPIKGEKGNQEFLLYAKRKN